MTRAEILAAFAATSIERVRDFAADFGGEPDLRTDASVRDFAAEVIADGVAEGAFGAPLTPEAVAEIFARPVEVDALTVSVDGEPAISWLDFRRANLEGFGARAMDDAFDALVLRGVAIVGGGAGASCEVREVRS